jgi:hypothetical protein
LLNPIPAGGATCVQVARRVTDFLEERLAAGPKADLLRHFETCVTCRTYAEQMALVRDCLKILPGASMSDNTRKRLMARLTARTSSA